MAIQIRGTFDVKITPQPDDSPVGRMTLDKHFHGDLDASSAGQMLAIRSAVEGSAGYVAMEWVSGSLQSRNGSFALQHSGTMDRGVPSLSITVVPDSGTGELAGLTGKMGIVITDGKHYYEFDYKLPDPAISIGHVIVCAANDFTTVVDLIAESFLHDPTWSWAFPDPAMRRRWWEICIKGAFRYPWCFRTSGFETVSVWVPPSGSELCPDDEARVAQILESLVGTRAAEVMELLQRFEAAHPREEPHYYLSLLGTADARRGNGLGMALLRENLARIDAEHAPAYLESSNPANNHRYQSVGFVPISKFQAPGGGPEVTGMWRTAR